MIDTITSEIATAIQAITTIPVVTENVMAETKEYIRVYGIPIEPEIISFGGRIEHHYGFVQIDLMQTTGSGINTTLLNQILAVVTQGKRQSYEIVKTYRLSNGKAPISLTANAFISSIRIDYRYYV